MWRGTRQVSVDEAVCICEGDYGYRSVVLTACGKSVKFIYPKEGILITDLGRFPIEAETILLTRRQTELERAFGLIINVHPFSEMDKAVMVNIRADYRRKYDDQARVAWIKNGHQALCGSLDDDRNDDDTGE